jgi:hypothetical protein
MKQCCTCHEHKSVLDFHKNKKNEDGLHKSCKSCRKQESQRRFEKHRDEINKKAMERHFANRESSLARMREYQQKNKETLSEKAKEYRKNNKEMFSEKGKLYTLKNAERLKEYRAKTKEQRSANFKKYASNNRGRLAAIKMKRYTSQKQRTPPWLTEEHFEAIRIEYELSAWCSKVMNTPYHVDHIVPLQGRNVSGLHVPWNLQVIPADENIRKGNKFNGNIMGTAALAN